MKKSSAGFKNKLLISTLCLLFILAILIGVGMQSVQADMLSQPIGPAVSDSDQYLRLTDAPLRRDIGRQRFAPLEVRP